jgi:ComF family protein
MQGRIFASLVSVLRSSAESLFATSFPSDCRLCGVPLTNISRLPVCEECLSQIHAVTGGICEVCGERLPRLHVLSSQCADQRCGLCRRIQPPFAKPTASGRYHGVIRDLIHLLLKYEQVRPAANVLKRMLARAIAKIEPSLGASLLAVPVPLHSRKLRHRGFNQSELIARAALKLGPARQRSLFSTAVLERTRETQSQIGLMRHPRRENLRGAFSMVKPEAIRGREILLVDDVFTTGTTLWGCARVLRRAGASKVWVATVARTMKQDAHVEMKAPAAPMVAAAS